MQTIVSSIFDGTWFIKDGEPKTRPGRRNIMLPDVAIEALRGHQVYQELARIKASGKWQERGIVFCNIYGGFFSPSHVGDLFQELLKKAGLPHMRFHDLLRYCFKQKYS